MSTLQIRQFEAYRIAYKEHYAVIYERHTRSDDPLSALCNRRGGGLRRREHEELIPGRSDSLLGPSRQDTLEVVRMKNDPVGYQTREALKTEAEVRSNYECK